MSDSTIPELSAEEMQTKVDGWLEKQKLPAPKKAKITGNDQLMALRNNLDYDLATTEKKNEKETFLVIPVKDGYKSRNNEEKNPVNNLVLVLNESQEITHGNIIQYIPAAGKSRAVPKNTISDIFNYRKVSVDGTFSILTTTDYFRYELMFADGALKSIAVPEKRPSQNGRTSSTCIDWYLVTIITYADGRTERYEDYLYTQCYEDDPCLVAKIMNGKVMPTECTGGGGGGDIAYDYEYINSEDGASSFLGGLEISDQITGIRTWNVGYKWRCGTGTGYVPVNHNYSWEYYSYESGVVEKSNTDDQWRFKGYITHGTIELAGTPRSDATYEIKTTLFTPNLSADKREAPIELNWSVRRVINATGSSKYWPLMSKTTCLAP